VALLGGAQEFVLAPCESGQTGQRRVIAPSETPIGGCRGERSQPGLAIEQLRAPSPLRAVIDDSGSAEPLFAVSRRGTRPLQFELPRGDRRLEALGAQRQGDGPPSLASPGCRTLLAPQPLASCPLLG
jgi:hypothetical protein